MSIEETDSLLRAKEAAEILGCSKQFLYQHAKELSYAVFLTTNGNKNMVRFSSAGIQKFIARRLKIQEARTADASVPEFRRREKRLIEKDSSRAGILGRPIKYPGTNKQVKRCWDNMTQRCNNPAASKYERYGGRGIKVLMTINELNYLWERDGAAEMKSPSIDRIDNNGHYTLENCRFVEFTDNRRRKIQEARSG